MEIKAIPEFPSAIELAGIRLTSDESCDYQPLCYESAGSLERYEKLHGDGFSTLFRYISYTKQRKHSEEDY